ncbi:MAG: hypothetical protein GY751_18500 [Bacteroidetes bacterium]|nr:hypothetical protein [Bacteroidota bacterium]
MKNLFEQWNRFVEQQGKGDGAPIDEKEIRAGILSYYAEMYDQYGDDAFPSPDGLGGLSIEEIEELIDDLEETENSFEKEFLKKSSR